MHAETHICNRVRIDHPKDAMTITVRSILRLGKLAFISVWLSGWSYGGILALGVLLFGNSDSGRNFFIALWLIPWAAGFAFGAFMFLWILWGREQLTIDNSSITKRISVRLFTRTWNYDLVNVSNIRKTPDLSEFLSQSNLENPFGKTGRIAFDHNDETVTFGAGLDEAEADFLLNTVLNKLNLTSEAA